MAAARECPDAAKPPDGPPALGPPGTGRGGGPGPCGADGPGGPGAGPRASAPARYDYTGFSRLAGELTEPPDGVYRVRYRRLLGGEGGGVGVRLLVGGPPRWSVWGC
ncbi:hypothetical protein GCM10020000_71670 [Streptomyces olivoverticillatus]